MKIIKKPSVVIFFMIVFGGSATYPVVKSTDEEIIKGFVEAYNQNNNTALDVFIASYFSYPDKRLVKLFSTLLTILILKISIQ